MNPAPRPEVVAFPPGSGELPTPLRPALTDPETHLLLVVAGDGRDEWARAAIGLAQARTAAGHSTVLADAGLGSPRLHRLLEVPNLEGLADVFEFGASLERVVVRPEGRSFDLVPAGAYVPDPGAVLRSDRWDRLADELAAESTAMLVYVSADTPGVTALSRRAGRAIVVGDEAAAATAIQALDPSTRIVAVVDPTAGPGAGEPAEAAEHATLPFGEPRLTEPVVFRSDRAQRRRSPLLWVLLAVLVAAGGWLGWQQLLAPPTPTPEVQAQPDGPPPPEPQPVETPIGYSVAVEAHQDLGTAQERVEYLRRAAPEIGFYIAPVPIGGSVWHRVLAGPVTDQESGMALMRELVDEGFKSDFDSWAVRPTEWAFKLGEFDDRAEADRVVGALAQRDIPAYVVMIRYEPGEPRYRIYAGAFENEAAAEIMASMLEEAGLDASLIPRVGEPIVVDS